MSLSLEQFIEEQKELKKRADRAEKELAKMTEERNMYRKEYEKLERQADKLISREAHKAIELENTKLTSKLSTAKRHQRKYTALKKEIHDILKKYSN